MRRFGGLLVLFGLLMSAGLAANAVAVSAESEVAAPPQRLPKLVPQGGHSGYVSAPALSDDGSVMVTTSNYDRTARVWDVVSGDLRAIIPTVEKKVIVLSP